MNGKLLLAVSSCLLGNKVRYDGQSKSNQFILDELANFCDFVAVCPEHLAFGTPRPTIQVNRDLNGNGFSVVEVNSAVNVSADLEPAIASEIKRLQALPIDGIILKSGSPSCGVGSCLHFHNNKQVGVGDGLFALACKQSFPELPLEEESNLKDPSQKEAFIKQLLAQ